MEYVIGLVDEEPDQLSAIRRTIKTHIHNQDIDVSFKVYPLEGGADTLSENVANDVLHDIVSGAINSLVIDYKIMIQSAMVEGTDIYKRILEKVPKFPVIILTNVPDDCYKKSFVDADKVYSKRAFFKLEGDYSKDKTKSILINMQQYHKRRTELATKQTEQLEKIRDDGFSLEVYQELLHVEKKLGELYPQDQTQVDIALDLNDLKEAVDLLDRADKLRGGSDYGA